MLDKRHLVLYGLAGIALILVIATYAAGRTEDVSDIASTTVPEAPATASAPVIAEVPQPPFALEVVTDPKAQELGLGGRTDIPQNYGMLFVFPNQQTRTFWMKGMLTSIDIIWLSDSGAILGIEDSVSPESYAGGAVFKSPKPVWYVLETRAGEARRLGWEVGDHVPFTLP